jgi:hypothetical protein
MLPRGIANVGFQLGLLDKVFVRWLIVNMEQYRAHIICIGTKGGVVIGLQSNRRAHGSQVIACFTSPCKIYAGMQSNGHCSPKVGFSTLTIRDSNRRRLLAGAVALLASEATFDPTCGASHDG